MNGEVFSMKVDYTIERRQSYRTGLLSSKCVYVEGRLGALLCNWIFKPLRGRSRSNYEEKHDRHELKVIALFPWTVNENQLSFAECNVAFSANRILPWDLLSSSLVFSPKAGFGRNQSPVSDRYGSGTLHSRQFLRGRLPLLSPAFRRSHFRL